MNIVKSKIRNRLSIKKLNAILKIRYGLRRHGKCCHNYILPPKILHNIEKSEKYKTQKKHSRSLSMSDIAYEVDMEDIDIPELS